MRAVILAAGKGTRMRELTHDLPKPMLEVHGRPILDHIVAGLKSAGITEIGIITGYRGDVIRDYFKDGSARGLRIEYFDQAVQDGTGKAPELAKSFVGDQPFLLTYGDILVKEETYRKMRDRFAPSVPSVPFSGLLTVTPGEDVSKGAICFFDDAFCLRAIVEKPPPERLEEFQQKGLLRPGEPPWYNAGIYIFQPAIYEFTARLERSPRGEYELPDAIMGMVLSGGRVAGLAIEGGWVDVRDPEVLAQLDQGGKDL